MQLRETFAGPTLDPALRWRNPPPDFALTSHGLAIETAAQTDFWQRTHYGFRVDNGHHLALSIAGDLTVTTKVVSEFRHQYDQAGLLLWASPDCWVKTAVEWESADEPARLGAVVTNAGYSDWSTQDLAHPYGAAWFRIERRGDDVTVYAGTGPADGENPGALSQIRLARLHAGPGLLEAGLYACSPKGAGFVAHFSFLEISP